ncbi:MULTISPECIES: hypothetical protein [unclassified Leifsonia]|uniref:hypothetical protein n=1 Tax=unclassified Leifsonia TaxID=2663824 RepID=UPI0011135B33|nr:MULTISPECIES: hypothetical protein [unclassified Leifsonia]
MSNSQRIVARIASSLAAVLAVAAGIIEVASHSWLLAAFALVILGGAIAYFALSFGSARK